MNTMRREGHRLAMGIGIRQRLPLLLRCSSASKEVGRGRTIALRGLSASLPLCLASLRRQRIWGHDAWREQGRHKREMGSYAPPCLLVQQGCEMARRSPSRSGQRSSPSALPMECCDSLPATCATRRRHDRSLVLDILACPRQCWNQCDNERGSQPRNAEK